MYELALPDGTTKISNIGKLKRYNRNKYSLPLETAPHDCIVKADSNIQARRKSSRKHRHSTSSSESEFEFVDFEPKPRKGVHGNKSASSKQKGDSRDVTTTLDNLRNVTSPSITPRSRADSRRSSYHSAEPSPFEEPPPARYGLRNRERIKKPDRYGL